MQLQPLTNRTTGDLVPHPLTGAPIYPIGTRRDGSPIWPIMGGASDPEDPEKDPEDPEDLGDPADPEDPEKDPEDPEDLGDKGKQAIDRMKGQRNKARADLKQFKDLGLTPAQIKALKDAKGDDPEQPSADEIRETARREAREEAARERVEDKIEAKAARSFADPSDAVAILLRTSDINDFLDDGKVDVEAISEALEELLESKPHLAAQGGKKFGGGADTGPRKAARPNQLKRSDLARMSPQEITKARKDGRLDDLMGIEK